MAYARLRPVEFGRELLRTEDLDPVYVALVNAKLRPELLKRWLVAYWCTYHAGVSSWLSWFEGVYFWDALAIVAENELASPIGGRFPRSRERRHWRGKLARSTVETLSTRYPGRPEAFVDYVVEGGSDHFAERRDRVREHHGFGPWIAFKALDMIDRVLGVNAHVPPSGAYMYEAPTESALSIWERRSELGLPFSALVAPRPLYPQSALVEAVFIALWRSLQDAKAPPGYDRPVGPLEVETVLCKWASHDAGRYQVGNDIRELREALRPWADVSEVAWSLLDAAPKEILSEPRSEQ